MAWQYFAEYHPDDSYRYFREDGERQQHYRHHDGWVDSRLLWEKRCKGAVDFSDATDEVWVFEKIRALGEDPEKNGTGGD